MSSADKAARWIALLLGLSSIAWLAWVDWRVAVAVWCFVFANNIERDVTYRARDRARAEAVADVVMERISRG